MPCLLIMTIDNLQERITGSGQIIFLRRPVVLFSTLEDEAVLGQLVFCCGTKNGFGAEVGNAVLLFVIEQDGQPGQWVSPPCPSTL
mmetsp:Transcript_106440/g.266745  ORF Transcript_106440/g.266745 Transcript_106440/m.266745 type:complete len:86 (-) Transcript_106440:72-329(-)